MQVKKFEARSMKEALEMIKTQLGPDAIILSAKEITKAFGLSGEKSIEVTAAYSETTLQKKKFVESKLMESDKEKFQKISAKSQKEVMRKMIETQVSKMNSQAQSAQNAANLQIQKNQAQKIQTLKSSAVLPRPSVYKMTERRYIEIDNEQGYAPVPLPPPSLSAVSVTDVAKKAWGDMEVMSLKEEIETLRHCFKLRHNLL